jgi:DNA-binding transcriptional ArsR family regulator
MISEMFEDNIDIIELFSSKGRSRILRLLAIETELNISKIVSTTKMNHGNVKTHLEYFIKIGFIQEKIYGRIRIYRYRLENRKAKSLKNLINFWENRDGDL